MDQDPGPAPPETQGAARQWARGGADQPAAVVDPERFAHQFRIGSIVVVVLALLATVGAVLAVSVFR